jgi:predicted dinucleotide-binding enzyme
VTRLYDRFGFDTVDAGPLRESWRSTPGTAMWRFHDTGQSRADLVRNLARAERVPRP